MILSGHDLTIGYADRTVGHGLDVALAKGEVLALKGRGKALSVDEASARDQLVQTLRTAQLAPPRVDELAHAVGLPPPRTVEVLKLLAGEGEIFRVSDELYFHKAAIEELKGRLVEHLKTHKEITTQAFKDLVGQSRKYVIPLSEFFDREKVTLRVGDKRVLRRG